MKAPFPYFGGKKLIAEKVWEILGDCDGYVEPFFGSGAMLWKRPNWEGTYELINDKDCHVANVWRSIRNAPDQVAEWADFPINHAELNARSEYLKANAKAMRQAVGTDESYFDPKMAGYWIWCACLWIGASDLNEESKEREDWNRPIPRLSGVGIFNQECKEWNTAIPVLGKYAGIFSKKTRDNGFEGEALLPRNNGIYNWMRVLANRLKDVTGLCGDWKRGLHTIEMGQSHHIANSCAIFLDPPYGGENKHDIVYTEDSFNVAKEVREWCVANGSRKHLRIALCGYGNEHDELLSHGWQKLEWKASGGYGNQNKEGNDNSKLERVWYSPNCTKPNQPTLF